MTPMTPARRRELRDRIGLLSDLSHEDAAELLAEVERLAADLAGAQHALGERSKDCERTRDALLPLLVGRPPYSDELRGDRAALRAGYVASVAGYLRDGYEAMP